MVPKRRLGYCTRLWFIAEYNVRLKGNNLMTMPTVKPLNPRFSSGPTSKRPGWNIASLSTTSLGRSHRATDEKAKLRSVIEQSKDILGILDNRSIHLAF